MNKFLSWLIVALHIGFIIVAMITLSGCTKTAEHEQRVNAEFIVDKLFTYQGCTMYRFFDRGTPIYYSNCDGQTMTYKHCGKNCERFELVRTNKS